MKNIRLSAGAALLLCASIAPCWIDAAAQTQDRPDSSLANPLAAQPLDLLSATVERPLFSASRRPPAPPPVAQAPPSAPPAPPPNVVLVGIVMDGDGARAIMRAGAENKVIRAQIGDDVGGWKVSQIDGRKMVLSLDDRFATFTLFDRAADPRAMSDGDNAKTPSQQTELKQDSPSPNDNAVHRGKRRRARH